ncbi:PIG-L family deacetylase [Acidobacteria bacterium AH-259-L09]|nr:PIG-L family deacetylase [Acidobacteria bacterium AH-259-L09]
MHRITFIVVFLMLTATTVGQPETPVKQWTGKSIMLIGAHPDDDSNAHGTLAMLQANGNQVYVVLLTTGNVGTQDPKLSRFELATIRRQEELAALAELGIPGDHYTNLGYDDGLLEFADKLEVVGKLVRLIRTIRPDVLFAFDSGPGYRRWHKTDHRAASYLAADATRAAMWRLLFEAQIIHEGLKAYQIPEFMFFDSAQEEKNTWVDISDFAEKKVKAGLKYVSQFSSGWSNYTGPDLPEDEQKKMLERIRGRLRVRNGKTVEGFRHYKGMPDGMGK